MTKVVGISQSQITVLCDEQLIAFELHCVWSRCGFSALGWLFSAFARKWDLGFPQQKCTKYTYRSILFAVNLSTSFSRTAVMFIVYTCIRNAFFGCYFALKVMPYLM